MNSEAVNIVLIEDNPDHATLVMRNLNQFVVSNKVIHLEDGEQALNYFSDIGKTHKKPHLILLDLRLPKIDGLEVLCHLKTSRNLADIPVVILTTSDAESDMANACSCHANSYLIKPLDFSKFAEMMNALGFYWICWNKNPY